MAMDNKAQNLLAELSEEQLELLEKSERLQSNTQ